MEIILLTIALLMLDLAALLWGADSREDAFSQEWQRRAARGGSI
jgi:hypothetical protein